MRAGGVHKRRRRCHFNYFLSFPNLHGHIKRNDLVELQKDAVANIVFEPREIELEAVGSHRNLEKREVPSFVGGRSAAHAAGFIDEGDLDSGEDSASSIRHFPNETPPGTLG